jgi:hypothetical protein
MDKDLTASPLPEQVIVPQQGSIEYDFPGIIRKIIEGSSVTRKEWNNPQFFCLLLDGKLMLHKDDDKYYEWIIIDGDLFATDWIILNG